MIYSYRVYFTDKLGTQTIHNEFCRYLLLNYFNFNEKKAQLYNFFNYETAIFLFFFFKKILSSNYFFI
jgi:hypothetical protein